MRSFLSTTPLVVLIAAALAVASPVGAARAQDKADTGAQTDAPAPKQVALTQKTIDGLLDTQKQIRDLEAKMPKDAKEPDAKTAAAMEAAMKKNGFASANDFSDASYSVGLVLAGIDADTGKYIGVEAATKKQIAEVNADKQMPPKEKKEAVDELKESLKNAGTDKPMQGNIDLVTANYAKLNEGLKQSD